MLKTYSRITKTKQKIIIAQFLAGTTATYTAKMAKVNRKTVNLYFNHFREAIFDSAVKAPRFYGEVEMDQAFYGRGTKKIKSEVEREQKKAGTYGDPYWELFGKKFAIQDPWGKRINPVIEQLTRVTFMSIDEIRARDKFKRIKKKRAGHKIVFGILQRGSNQVYTKVIEHADRKTLFPIIHMIVAPESYIYTDQWGGFNDLGIDGYTHKTVNHSVESISSDGTHAGTIDAFWSYSKKVLGRFNHIHERTFILHLKESEWRWNHKDESPQELERILKVLVKGPLPFRK